MTKVTIDFEHQKTHEGNSFHADFKQTTVANGTSRYLRLISGDYASHLIIAYEASGKFEFTKYINATYSAQGTLPDGDVLTHVNRILGHPLGKTTVRHTPTIIDKGDLVSYHIIAGGTGPQAEGVSGNQRAEFIVPANTDILLEVKNTSGQNQDVSLGLDWYEVEPEYRYSIPTLTLSELTVEDIEETALTLVPTFDSDVKVYAIDEVDYLTRQVVIAAEPQEDEEFAIIRGLGVIDLGVGENVLNVGIIYPEFNGSNYQISIPREDGALLSALSAVYEVTIEEEPVEIELIEDFDPDVFEYEATVANEIDEIDVTATPLDEATTVLIDGQPSPETILLTEGLNEIDVVCTLADHTTLTYSLKITREEAE